MPKKTGHKTKRSSKRAHHHAHPAGGHHERLRQSHAAHDHAHSHKRPKRRARAGATAPVKHHHGKKVSKRATTDRHVTEQTLRDHMALACIRRCAH